MQMFLLVMGINAVEGRMRAQFDALEVLPPIGRKPTGLRFTEREGNDITASVHGEQGATAPEDTRRVA